MAVIDESYWMETAEAPKYATLSRDLEVDVAVVGGGMAGLSTAWELVNAGRSVAVLEAERVAAGVTSYSTAKLTALHGLIYQQVASVAGATGAHFSARSQQDAIEHVARTADELGIDCQFERRPAFTYAESEDQLAKVIDEVKAAEEAGLPASFVTETGLPFRVAGAVRVEDQAQFHPRRYLLGLANAITAAGGAIHEGSRVAELDEGDPCELTTTAGAKVRARDVVVATHYPVFDRALLFARLVPKRELVVAAPIPAEQDPGGSYLTPEQNTRSVRTAPYRDGQRMLVATGEKFTPGAGQVTQRFEHLASWVRDRFGIPKMQYRWATQDNWSTDQIPYVGPLHPFAKHTYVATGFGGWGLTSSVMSARLLTGLITGQAPRWAKLYDPRRLHPRHEVVPMAQAQAKVAGHFVGDRVSPPGPSSLDEIKPASAGVIRTGGKLCAVYRDPLGIPHAVSATCTHLGCVVAFNDAENAWECPCHGSRFALDGSVIEGPANRPLEQRDLDES